MDPERIEARIAEANCSLDAQLHTKAHAEIRSDSAADCNCLKLAAIYGRQLPAKQVPSPATQVEFATDFADGFPVVPANNQRLL